MAQWQEHLEVVRGALRCTRAEGLALAVLATGAVAVLGVVLWLAVPADEPAAGDTLGDAAEGEGPEALAPTAPDRTGSEGSPDAQESSPGQPSASSPAEPAQPAPVTVHVSGHVARPGVVTVTEDDRVADAIGAAGGAVDGADLEALNLARIVRDGERVHVPHVDDDAAARAKAHADAAGDDQPVSLNHADAAALEELPGVGEVTAQRILDHRDAHGEFTAVDELLEVPGIGEATLEQLRDHLVP